MTVELAIGLADIGGTLLMAGALVISMQSSKRERRTEKKADEERIAVSAAKDQKYTDDIAHIEREAERAYAKAQEVADNVNERFEKIEGRQQDGDIVTAEIGRDVKHILAGIETMDKKLDEHIRRTEK